MGLASILFLFTSTAFATTPSVQILRAGPQVVQEYCETSWPQTLRVCTAPNGDVALLQFPPVFQLSVTSHLNQAFAAGYFDTLSMEDMFHGHVIPAGSKETYADLEDLLNDTPVVLYHSAEYLQRWPADHRERSFLGWFGEIPRLQTAIDFVSPSQILKGYHSSGTIYPEEIAASDPKLTRLHFKDWGVAPDILVTVCEGPQCRQCHLETMFYIRPGVDAGGPLQVYAHCEFEPAEGPLEMLDQNCPGSTDL